MCETSFKILNAVCKKNEHIAMNNQMFVSGDLQAPSLSSALKQEKSIV